MGESNSDHPVIDMTVYERCTAGSRPSGQKIASLSTKDAVSHVSSSRGLCVSVSAASAAVATEEPKTQAKGAAELMQACGQHSRLTSSIPRLDVHTLRD